MLSCKYLPDHCLHLLFRVDLHFHELRMSAKQETRQQSEDDEKLAHNKIDKKNVIKANENFLLFFVKAIEESHAVLFCSRIILFFIHEANFTFQINLTLIFCHVWPAVVQCPHRHIQEINFAEKLNNWRMFAL